MPTVPELELAEAVAAWGGRGDQSCEDAAKTPEEHMFCRSPSTLLKGNHVSTPLFVRQSQLDAVQLKRLIPASETDMPAKAFRQRFAAEMRNQLGLIGPQYAIFSPLDNMHGVINSTSEYTSSTVGTKKLPPTLAAWYRDPCAVTRDIATP